MGNKNKQNGEAGDTDSTPPKDEDVGAEGDETTDDEGGVDTPPPQKDEEEQEDAQNEDGTFENAMAPKKRPAEGAEMTMQTRKAMCFSYSELDEDQDEVMPAGTRTRKVKAKPEPKPLKPVPPKKRQTSPAKSVGRPPLKKEPEEYEVEKILNERQKRGNKEYLVQWKNKGPKHNSWEPEENMENCRDAVKKFHDSQKKKKPEKPLKEVRKGRAAKAAEVEEEQEVESPARSRRTGKNRSYSEFYDQ